eukprot:3663507-Pyramimonas_sp.AAC.1
MAIYVDDFLLAATPTNAKKRWHEPGQQIVFREAYAEVLRYLGALCHFDCADPAKPLKVRTVATSMSGHLRHLADKFRLEFRDTLRK